MKLYTLFNSETNMLIAISLCKEYIYKYIVQNCFGDTYKVNKITDSNIAERMLIMYDGLLLDEFGKAVLTSYEQRSLNHLIDEGTSDIMEAINSINRLLYKCKFNEKSKEDLKKAVRILNRSLSPKRIPIILQVKSLIEDMFLPDNKAMMDHFRKELEAKDDMYYIHINVNN